MALSAGVAGRTSQRQQGRQALPGPGYRPSSRLLPAEPLPRRTACSCRFPCQMLLSERVPPRCGSAGGVGSVPSFGGSGSVSSVAGFGSALAIISSRRARAALAFSILSGVRGARGCLFQLHGNTAGPLRDCCCFGRRCELCAALGHEGLLSSAVISAFATMPHRLSFRA